MKFTEEQLKQFAAPLCESENQLCLNVFEMVRDALKGIGFTDDNKAITKMFEETLAYTLQMRSFDSSRRIKIFIQGSYANNTNVNTLSDVDIAVVQEEVFQTIYREGVTNENYHFSTAPTTLKSFKDEVYEYLKIKFGNDVERKNKSIKVNGNTYRKDADTIPCWRYRNYSQEYQNNPDNYYGGIYIRADDGTIIINYPEQHIENGRKKNIDTNTYYKKMVRIIKKIRYLMDDSNYMSAKNVSSFGLESLLWNIPNEIFKKFSIYRFEVDEIINYLCNNVDSFYIYKEVNGIKQLCPTPKEVENYSKFLHDLNGFYEYDIGENNG